MAKYDPLRNYLRRQKLDALELTFVEIERKIGYMLPNGARMPQWWNNATESSNISVQNRAWRDAGFDAALVLGADRVRFERVRPHTSGDYPPKSNTA